MTTFSLIVSIVGAYTLADSVFRVVDLIEQR